MTTQHELLDAAIKRVGNRYLATMLVAKRIRQLHHGAPPYVSRDGSDSHFTVAMREIAEGRVVLAPSSGEEDTLIAAAAASAQERPLPVPQSAAAATPEATASDEADSAPSAEGPADT